MSEPVYVARSEVGKVAGVHRRGRMSGGTVVEMGVHGPIKSLYGLQAEPDLPLPVDYIVVATGG